MVMIQNKKTKTVRAFIVMGFIIGILLIILLLKATDIFASVNIAVASLQAFLFGIVFSCIMSPMLKGFENLLSKKLSTPEKPRKELIRGLGVALTLAVTLFIIIAVIIIVIPQVGVTVEKIIPSFRNMVDGFNDWVQSFSDNEIWQERVYPFIQEITTNISKWVMSNMGAGTDIFNAVTSGIMSAVNVLFNMLIGLILSVYLLLSKEKLFAQIEKLCKAIFKEKWGTYIMDIIDEGARIFSGFFGAKILEAILMGVLCFVGMFIMQLPYATLISVLVGIANIIPFFGPYIGTILGAALIVLVNPWQALYYVIFMIVLVQFDGNIMGPKILGHSTGLSPMWVIVSILLFGGTLGIVGTFIGVPVFAWIYYIVKKIAENSLVKQDLPTSTDEYEEMREEEKEREEKMQDAREQNKAKNEKG
jgi:predicted PurR-regulated permease PerM